MMQRARAVAIWSLQTCSFNKFRILEEEFEKAEALEKLKEQQEQELLAERQRRVDLEQNLQVCLTLKLARMIKYSKKYL